MTAGALALCILAPPPALADRLDGWFAAGKAGLEGKPAKGLAACGAGGEAARAAFGSFSPGEHAAAAAALDAGTCDVSLSGTPGTSTLGMMKDAHPSRAIYEFRGGTLKQLRAASDLPPWMGFAKAGRAAVALDGAVLCGTGAWRNEYRKKVKSASNVATVQERLRKVDDGSCDLAVLTREEAAALGAGRYASFGLYPDGARPTTK